MSLVLIPSFPIDSDFNVPSIRSLGPNAMDFLLTTTGLTSVLTYTPQTQANFMVCVYYRVVNATTNLTVTASWTDIGGARSEILIDGSKDVGIDSMSPLYINATSSPITIQATAGTSNNIYVTASIHII